MDGIKIGIFDPRADTYRKINTDGTLSKPGPKPWSDRPAPAAVPTTFAKVEPAREDPAPASTSPVPIRPMTTFGLGGGLSGMILVIRLCFRAMNRR